MGNEDIDEDQPSEGMVGRKRGSGQVPSGTNPRGAGRPSGEWLEFKREQAEFQAWKEARNRGEFTSNAEVISRLLGHGERDSDRDSKRDTKGLVERIVKIAGLEKQFKALNLDWLTDEVISLGKDFAPVLAPILGPAVPYLVAVPAVIVGVTAWYMLEEWQKTEIFTREEWDVLPYDKKVLYYIINGVDIRKEDRSTEESLEAAWSLVGSKFKTVTVKNEDGVEAEDYLTEDIEIVEATRDRVPQVLHTYEDILIWFTKTIESVLKWVGVEDFILFKVQRVFPEIIKGWFAWLTKLFSIFKKTGIAPPVTEGVHGLPEEPPEVDADYEPDTEHTFDIDPIDLDDKLDYDPPPDPPPEETYVPPRPEETEDPFVKTEEEETTEAEPIAEPETTKDEETKEEEEEDSSTSIQEEEEEEEETTYTRPRRI